MNLKHHAFLVLFLLILFASCRINRIDKKGRRIGKWEHYYSDDKKELASKGKYKKGKEKGLWVHYRINGDTSKTEDFGKIFIETKLYHTNKELRKEGKAKWDSTKTEYHYFWTGEWKEYSEKGELIAKEYYTEGKIHKKEHFIDGKLVSIGMYKDGVLNEVIQ